MPVIDLTNVVKQDDRSLENKEAATNTGELAQQVSSVGELAQNTSNTGETVEQALKEDQKAGSRVVRLDGPLSSVYTQALNIAYAKETVADGTMDSLSVQEDEDDDGVNPDLYVYVTSQAEMGKLGGVNTFDQLRLALDRYKDIQTAVVIEDFKPVGRTGLAIEEYSHSQAGRVYYTRSAAIGAITAFLNGG